MDKLLFFSESRVLLTVPETRRGTLMCRMARHLAQELGLADSETLEHDEACMPSRIP